MNYFHQMLTARTYGGANTIALNLAVALRDCGEQSYAWIPGEGPAKAKAEEMGLTMRLYDPTRALASSRLSSALCNWTIARQLYSYRPGLIHVHSPHFYRALWPALKMSQLKTVVHVHLEEEREGLRWALRRPPDIIITCARFLSEYVRSVLPIRFQDNQQIIAASNAVDTKQFFPGDKNAAKVRFGVPVQTPLVLMVANLARHKGQETALRTASMLRKSGVVAQFWFAGVERGNNQEYTSRLQALVNDLGLTDHVRFLGQRKDIPDLLRAADFFILPSTTEGLPLSVLEAQASGTPVLAAPTAGIPEVVIDGETGFLVGADDAAGYAHHLVNLLCKPNLYSKIADRAYTNVVKEHSWKTYVERVYAVYQTVASN
jgi:glycosyltransferase involved in cell wall biosynthesis